MTIQIQPCALPEQALLSRYARSGAFTDCWSGHVPRAVSHAAFVEAFYTGAVFKVERLLLAWAVSRPSTDAQAKALAEGALDTFAAWKVEDRALDQLLMCDMAGRTRSWLMTAPAPSGTRLYFGSAVVPVRDKATGESTMGFAFTALLGFHKLYSRVLLRAACSRLARAPLTPA